MTLDFLCTREFAARIIENDGGPAVVVNISSIARHGNAGQSNYSAAKAGMIGLTKTTARELASRNITVNAIAPGYIATDMTSDLNEKVKEDLIKHKILSLNQNPPKNHIHNKMNQIKLIITHSSPPTLIKVTIPVTPSEPIPADVVPRPTNDNVLVDSPTTYEPFNFNPYFLALLIIFLSLIHI